MKEPAMDAVERLRATYEFKPVDHLYRREFYIWETALERWKREGMPAEADHRELFGFDRPAIFQVHRLGWCEPPLVPALKEEVLETGEDYEIVRDGAGRTVRVFKDKRHGFMPTYLKHAVETDKDWHEDIEPLLSPETPQRWEDIDSCVAEIKTAAQEGKYIVLGAIGGYMYLRSLIGPAETCYMLLDNPALIHKMMQAWLVLADAVAKRLQQEVEFDELFLAEDICYNHGLLISPDMVREFLLPYYQQLLDSSRKRQQRRLYFQVDTDGNCGEALDLYESIGLDVMSPFEVAAGNDVIEIAKTHPNLIISGGIDKRVLAAGPEAIDDYLDRVMPFMVKRGGYIPTCDHGVPDNVSFQNYMHYRKRMLELDN